MAHRKHENPSGSSIMWLALLGGAAYLAYEYLLAPNASASTVLAAAAPASTGTPTSNPAPSAASIPPLGATVTGAANVAAQAAANYPYIMPDPATISTAPSGYALAVDTAASETGTPNGSFYLRNDIANALVAFINVASAAAASGNKATLATLYQFPVQNLAQIQSLMTAQGLHGLGLMGLYPLYNSGRWN